MDIKEFRRIVTAFAYSENEVIFQKDRFVAQIHDEYIEGILSFNAQNDLIVTENDQNFRVTEWIVKRLGRVDLLARRIIDYLSYIEPVYFISPQGEEDSDTPNVYGEEIDNVPKHIINSFSKTIPGTTKVLYLTAKAGDGKTTVIRHIAKFQAENYIKNATNWILVPIELAGRHIIRLDDHIAGILVNTYRFNSLYYTTFLELVKMGVIVPALDGFEEMFVENASDEVISTLSNLLNSMESRGSLLISARTAYFNYEDIQTSAKLFDTLNNDIDATFTQLTIKEWNKADFIQYAKLRGLDNPESRYTKLTARIGQEHPIIKWPVFVKQLVDLALEGDPLHFDQEFDVGSQNYFEIFIHKIVFREATEKWVDLQTDPAQQLITVHAHHKILSEIAMEMWRSSCDRLSKDIIDVIIEMLYDKPDLKSKAKQIIKRIYEHALLRRPDKNKQLYGFEHEEIRNYYIGRGIIDIFTSNSYPAELLRLLRIGRIPIQALNTIGNYFASHRKEIDKCIISLNNICKTEAPSSSSKENIGSIINQLLSYRQSKEPIILELMYFDILPKSNGLINNIMFKDCIIQTLNANQNNISGCQFDQCTINEIHIESIDISVEEPMLLNTVIGIVSVGKKKYYDPQSIIYLLRKIGSIEPIEEEYEKIIEYDAEIEQTEKVLRYFRKSTRMTEGVLKLRLGDAGATFIKNTLPILLENGIVSEVDKKNIHKPYYQLNIQMSRIQDALTNCGGDFNKFITLLKIS